MSAPPPPARIAAAFADNLELLIGDDRPGWVSHEAGIIEVVAGLPVADFNNVFVTGAVAQRRVREAVDRLRATDLPFTLQTPGPGDAATSQTARNRGLHAGEEHVVLGIDRPLDVTSRDDLSITPCAGEDIRDHQRVLVDGFGMPEELARVTGGPALLDHSQVRSYVGRCDGEPTSTAISILARGGIATLYSVATRPAWRRRGHGAAVTARAVNDALAAGARWVVLTPSADGEPLYRGLGFAEIARWARWVTPDP